MLDFRRRTRSPNYLALPQQRKLLWLMVAAVFVYFLVSFAGDGKRWEWLFAGRNDAGKAAFAPDTRLKPANSGEANVFHAPSEGLSTKAADDPAAFFPGVRVDYLQTVRDDTVFRKEESDAWFHLLGLLQKSDASALAKGSIGKASFRQLYQQPREYRGRLVTLEGTIRGVQEKQAPKNTYGIDRYYQLAIEPLGEPNQLVIAYVLALPDGFPVSEQTNELATIHGFFFKRWAYAAADAVRTAPLLVAKGISWQPPAPVVTEPSMPLWMAGLIAFGLFIVAAGLYALSRLWKSPRRVEPTVNAEFTAGTLEAMAAADAGAEGFENLVSEEQD